MNLGGAIKPNAKGLALIFVVAVALFLLSTSRRPSGGGGGGDDSVSGRRLLEAALRAAVEGGAAVREAHEGPVRSKGKTAEGADDPLTDADVASHCRMVAALGALLPSGVRVASEERVAPASCPPSRPSASASTPRDDLGALPDARFRADDVTVWIDPLDATQEYTENLREYVTTMACVAVASEPLIGVVHRPFGGETVWAWVGAGKSSALSVVEPPPGRAPTVVVSRSHAGKAREFAGVAFGVDHRVAEAGGAGYKALELVAGRADVYLHVTAIKKWDVCAADAILRALGGRLTTLKNETIDYGRDADVVNADGVLAAVRDHDKYVAKAMKARFE